MQDFKNVRITIFRNVEDTLNPHSITISSALQRIKDGAAKELIDEIRLKTDKEERNRLKMNLACVMFSGEFTTLNSKVSKKTGEIIESYRDKESLTRHSHLVGLDWDDIEPSKIRPQLKEDPYIMACWVSPSGNGVKALIKIKDADLHEAHYNSIIAKYSKYGKLDTSSRNVNRVCYESYDPAIYINWESWVYADVLEERKKKSEATASGIISTYDYRKLNPIMTFLRNSREGERNVNLVKAATALSGYIESGYLPREVSMQILRSEYARVNPDEPERDVERAIENGMRYGASMPIYELDKKEKEIFESIGENQLDFLMDFDKEALSLMDIRMGRKVLNFTTGYPALDKYFIWKKGSFIVNLGHDNVGKTYVSMWMAVCTAMLHGWKWIIYSAENKMDAVLRDLMQFSANKSFLRMSDREFKFYKDFVREHFEVIDNSKMYSYNDILDMSQKILSRKRYDFLLIDPYNSLSKKGVNARGGAHEYDNEAASEMLSWTANSGCGIFLNVHTYTAAKRLKDENGLTRKPYKDDAEGGGKWSNKADYFTVTHRYTNDSDMENRYNTYFSVEKVRDKFTGGDIHPHENPFVMRLMDYSYFIDNENYLRPFEPLKPSLSEI